MKLPAALSAYRKLILADIILFSLGLLYFLFFVNRGIVLSDEGYYVYYAERIANGEMPYRDFVLQYSPGYFYLLAFLYEIFGVQVLIGRFVSLVFCLSILLAVQVLLYIYRIYSVKIHIVASLLLIVLGYPLLHIPIVAWVCVLLAVLLVLFYIKWHKTRKIIYIFILGILLTTALLFKQNLGAVFILFINCLIIASGNKALSQTLRAIAVLNGTWLLSIGFWIGLYYSQTYSLSGLVVMFAMSRQFIETYVFTYPPLTLLLEPTGFFKLLPYYFPVIYLLYLCIQVIKKQFEWEKLAFSVIALGGFFATVYPASDLLHVYPFLGIVLVSSLVWFYRSKFFNSLLIIMGIFIVLGIYLTFFMKSYRYEGYFLRETLPLHLPKTAGMQVDYITKSTLEPLYDFIQTHTKHGDYIFVYPFAPMLYTVLDRQNPTGIVQFVLLEAPDNLYSDERVIAEIKQKKVKYIIAVGPYIYDRKISEFIQKQKKIFIGDPYIIFEIDN